MTTENGHKKLWLAMVSCIRKGRDVVVNVGNLKRAFRASNSESEPVYDNAKTARYWLERMITLFEEMRLKE